MPVERKPIQLRITPELAAKINGAAESEGRSVNNWIERTLASLLAGWLSVGQDELDRIEKEVRWMHDEAPVMPPTDDYKRARGVDPSNEPAEETIRRQRDVAPKPVELMETLERTINEAKRERRPKVQPGTLDVTSQPNQTSNSPFGRKRDVTPRPKKGAK